MMKRIIVCIICLFAMVTSYAQTAESEQVFTKVEKMPEYPGGVLAMQLYLQTNIKYPQAANGAEGRILVQFIIDTDGSVTDAMVVKSVNPHLDAEALRVINAMPKWKPGTQKGKAVRVKFTIPINFKASNAKNNVTNVKSNNNPLNLPSPQWKKFVVPTTDGVKAYKEPNKGSLVLCMADEQLASETALSEYCWSDRKPNKDWSVMEWKFGTQDILPVLEETDGWYKVFIQLERGWTSYCGEPAIAYIEKSSVKEIVPKTITAKILEEKLPGSVKNVIASGKLKDLCLINDDSNFEMDDAYLLMGELKNNSLVVFTTSYKMDYIEDGKPIEINPDTESPKKRNILTFNKSKSFPHEYLGVSLLDVRKLTDEEIERLISAEDYKSKVMTAYYYFSEVDAFKRYPVQPKE